MEARHMAKLVRPLATALFALLLSTALLGCGGSEGSTQADDAGTQPTAETETAPREERATGTGTDIGQTPPEFSLADLDGNEVSLSDFAGKVVILDLWATWCPPCRQEIPFLVSLYEEYNDEGLEVVGIGLDRGGAKVLAPFVEANDVTYTILVGNEDVSRAYGVSSIPMTLMIDRDGRVASREVGFAPSMAEDMRTRVLDLLARRSPEA
jgi:peroxiredoxin